MSSIYTPVSVYTGLLVEAGLSLVSTNQMAETRRNSLSCFPFPTTITCSPRVVLICRTTPHYEASSALAASSGCFLQLSLFFSEHLEGEGVHLATDRVSDKRILHLYKLNYATMFRTSKKNNTFWASIVHPNKYPAHTIHNYSLAKTASTLSIWVPTYARETNVNYVFKHEPTKTTGGEDFGKPNPSPSDMRGKGHLSSDEEALRHPFKVCRGLIYYCFYLFFPSRFLDLNSRVSSKAARRELGKRVTELELPEQNWQNSLSKI